MAVVDLAGTVVHEHGFVESAFREALTEVGRAPGADFTEWFAGSRGASKLEMLEARLGGDAGAAKLAHTRFEAILEREVDRGRIEAIPGALDALRRIRAAGIRVSLTTGFARQLRSRVLERLGWASEIDLALSPEDVGRGRPWPDLALTSLLRLGGTDVRDLAVVGDTVNDLLAGTRAGAAIVAGVLTGAHNRVQLEAAPHTHILESIIEFADLLVGP